LASVLIIPAIGVPGAPPLGLVGNVVQKDLGR